MSERVHGGFEAFSAGQFDDAGSNLYVNAHGEIERIHRTDLNGDGWPDVVVPNTHGNLERGIRRGISVRQRQLQSVLQSNVLQPANRADAFVGLGGVR